MGCYINPPIISKEEFIQQHGKLIAGPEYFKWSDPDYLPVCLVDNFHFTAAAICFNKEEMSHFTSHEDKRPKLWFKLPLSVLLKVAPDLQNYLFKENN